MRTLLAILVLLCACKDTPEAEAARLAFVRDRITAFARANPERATAVEARLARFDAEVAAIRLRHPPDEPAQLAEVVARMKRYEEAVVAGKPDPEAPPPDAAPPPPPDAAPPDAG